LRSACEANERRMPCFRHNGDPLVPDAAAISSATIPALEGDVARFAARRHAVLSVLNSEIRSVSEPTARAALAEMREALDRHGREHLHKARQLLHELAAAVLIARTWGTQ
jgi:hypothetical protein